MTPETKHTAAALIEMVQAHRQALEAERGACSLRMAEIDAELDVLSAVKPPPKPRATRRDKGTTRKKTNGALDAQGDPVPVKQRTLPIGNIDGGQQ